MNSGIHAFFDKATFTITYVVWDPSTRDAVIIDPVLDYDPATQLVSAHSASKILNFVKEKNLNVHWVLDTHAHADHLSSAKELRTSGVASSWGVGEKMNEVFDTFSEVFHWPDDLQLKNLGVDRWFRDGEEFSAGSLRFKVMETPGHTPACLTYQVGENLFTGDALFMPDSGVGRCDFPGGSAENLYESVWNKLYRLPDHYSVFVGHDYQPGGRPVRYRCLLGEQKLGNVHLNLSTARHDFVQFRQARDKTLSAPRLLHPSLDWNLGAHQVVPQPTSAFSLANPAHG